MILERNRERLGCDLVVSADGAMWRADRPSMTVASRGMVGARCNRHRRLKGSAFGPPRRQRTQSDPGADRAACVSARRRRRVAVPGFMTALRPIPPSSRNRCGKFRRRRLFPRYWFAKTRSNAERQPASGAAMAGAHARIQRHLRRVLGTRNEDRHPLLRRRKNHLPPGRRPKTCQGDRGDRPSSGNPSAAGYAWSRAARPGSEAFSVDPDLPALAAEPFLQKCW